MADLEREITQGYEASRLLSAITPYLDDMQADVYINFQECPVRDEQALVLLKMQSNAIKGLRDKLQMAIDEGAIAAEQVRRMNDG